MAATTKVKYSVEGMTCHSCTKSIHSAVSELPGVQQVDVFLEGACATVVYDADLTNPNAIKETIEDCGFDVETVVIESLGRSDQHERSPCRKQQDVTFDVEGMVCHSCEKSIEGALQELNGVLDCRASLERNQSWIRYDTSRVSEDQLKTTIEDCGFDANVSGKLCYSSLHNEQSRMICCLEQEIRGHLPELRCCHE